jgi:hypothetical protein
MSRNRILLALVFSILYSAIFPSLALAGDSRATCEAVLGGFWKGVGGSLDIGTCTFSANHTLSLAQCDPGEYLVQTYSAQDVVSGETCLKPEQKGGGTRVSTGRFPIETVTLCLKGEKNGCVTFPLGTCIVQCTADPKLPGSAFNNLPSTALDTIYVRVINAQGETSKGSYTVCFDNPAMANRYIYKYALGSWVLVRSGSSDPLCAIASGDGAFYLGSE